MKQAEFIRLRAYEVLNTQWVADYGYSAPNTQVYPWQWLWDSCFHSLIWAALGDKRAVTETATMFGQQNADGCVPHMGYQKAPEEANDLWRQGGRSFLTQPPMYAHVALTLATWGYDVEALIAPTARGLQFLLDRRRHQSGSVLIVHPWEGGTDDSPRWDAWAPQPFNRAEWGLRKRQLLTTTRISPAGSAISNPQFAVAAAGFNALVAFNLREFHSLTGEVWARAAADEITAALDLQWDNSLATWSDWSERRDENSSVRTLEALLGVLVTAHDDRVSSVFEQLRNSASFGTKFGPAGLHQDEAEFSPTAYWRGSAWPQLTYLFIVAALRRGRIDDARDLHHIASKAAVQSGFAEYLDPLTGRGLGANPQGWAGLPCVTERMLSDIMRS